MGALLGTGLIFVLNFGVSVASSALAFRLVDETTFTPVIQNVSLPLNHPFRSVAAIGHSAPLAARNRIFQPTQPLGGRSARSVRGAVQ